MVIRKPIKIGGALVAAVLACEHVFQKKNGQVPPFLEYYRDVKLKHGRFRRRGFRRQGPLVDFDTKLPGLTHKPASGARATMSRFVGTEVAVAKELLRLAVQLRVAFHETPVLCFSVG